MEFKISLFNKKKALSFIHKMVLVAMLHSTFIAPSQEMIFDYLEHEDRALHYKGSKLSNYAPIDTSDHLIPSSSSLEKASSVSVSTDVADNRKDDAQKIIYPADIELGVIGASKDKPIDDPADNLFKFYIGENLPAGRKVFLRYELYGLQDGSGVSKSINERPAMGGYMLKYQAGWSMQNEEIDAAWLHEGVNKIMFTMPDGAHHQYKIKNLKIEIDGQTEEASPLMVINESPIHFTKEDKIYIKGFVRKASSTEPKVFFDDVPANVHNGQFEGFAVLTKEVRKRGFVVVKAIDSKGLLGQELFFVDELTEADKIVAIENSQIPKTSYFAPRTQGSIATDGATLVIGDSALSHSATISISKLRAVDIAPMASGMINVTSGKKAYRFSPDGTIFLQPISISIKYDKNLIPPGYTEKDIHTYYFNTDTKTWTPLKRETVDTLGAKVLSLTTHFSDYINGIIQTPESPETAAFTPTAMNDIKSADPAAEMTFINPPQVSQKGDANLDFPIKIPAGRKGMQPQLTVTYNSSAGNGWLGLGWNITVPSIAIDTRWGVPLLDPDKESEIYTLGGEQLMYPKSAGKDWMPNRHFDVTGSQYSTLPRTRLTTGQANFTMRKQGSFTTIQRIGTSVNNYVWKVTDSNGTISWYGGKNVPNENAVLRNSASNIVHWALYMTEDVFGNNVKYLYRKDIMSAAVSPNDNLNGATIFHIQNVYYTGTGDTQGNYRIQFKTDKDMIPVGSIKNDVSIDARIGVVQIDPYLLKQIIVYDGSATVRKYDFTYITGEFSKNLLKTVKEKDAADNEFYTNTFEYYDDIDGPDGPLFFRGTPVNIDPMQPSYKLGFGNVIGGSRINSNQSIEYGYEIRPAAGLQIRIPRHNSDPKKSITVGLPFGQSFSDEKGIISLTDVDGDGLDDVVYKTSQGLKFLPHGITYSVDTGGQIFANHTFGASKNINNVSSFYKSDGDTKTMFLESFDLKRGKFYIGKKRFKSKSTSSIFFTDGNNDGLMDIVNDGKVYFNYLNSSSEPTYTTATDLTPNMVITALPAIPVPVDADEADNEMVHYDYDVVRVWVAPAHGNVTISDYVAFQPTDPADRVIYSIETFERNYHSTPFRIYLTTLSATNSSETVNVTQYSGNYPPLPDPSPQEALRVFPGQRIFFRVHKYIGGKNYPVTSNPTISYGNAVVDQNNLSQATFNYSDSYILSKHDAIPLPGTGTVSFQWNTVTASYLSDDVTFKILKYVVNGNNNTETETLIYKKTCSQNNLTNVVSTINEIGGVNIGSYPISSIASNTSVYFKLVVESDSNVRWKDIDWRVKYTYTADTAATEAGIVGMSSYPIAKYSIFAHLPHSPWNYAVAYDSYQLAPFGPIAAPSGATISWQPPNSAQTYGVRVNRNYGSAPVFLSTENGSFTLVVKQSGHAIGKQKVNIVNGAIQFPGDAPINFFTGNIYTGSPVPISLEVYADGKNNHELYDKYILAISDHTNGDEGIIAIGYNWSQPFTGSAHLKVMRYNYYFSHMEHLGPLHRNWGQFFYNENYDSSGTIPQDSYGKLINPTIVDDPYLGQGDDLIAEIGLNTSTCSGGNEDCLEDQLDTALDLPLESTDFSVDEGNTIETTLDGIDLSAASVPQICLFPGNAYRTYHHDIFSPSNLREKWIGILDTHYSAASEVQVGDFDNSAFANVFADDDVELPPLASNPFTGMWSISKKNNSVSKSFSAGYGAVNFNKSFSSYSRLSSDFMDINGDGYPDIVTSGQIQKTNMTGGHLEPFNYNYGPITSNVNKNFGATVSGGYTISGRASDENKSTNGKSKRFNMGKPSARIGLSVNLDGENTSDLFWIDINGDGLSDRLEKNGSVFKFKLNNGTLNPLNTFNHANTNDSGPSALAVSGSISVGAVADLFTSVDLPMSFDLSIGASVSGGKTERTFIDMNGDGLPDLVTSDNGTGYVRYNLGNKFSDVTKVIKSHGSVGGGLDFQEKHLLEESTNTALSVSGEISAFAGFPICCPFPFIGFLPIIHVKFGATVSGDANLNISDIKKSFRDFDGDGHIDYIEKSGINLTVYPSTIGRTNMLKSVVNPLGGKFTIDYAAQVPTYLNPHPKWAMTQVLVQDNIDKQNDGEDYTVTRYNYQKGYYDRREREFYGYSDIIQTDHNLVINGLGLDIQTPYRSVASSYHNSNYFLAGLLKTKILRNAAGSPFAMTENYYHLRELNTANNGITSTILPETFDTGGTEGRRSAAVVLTQTITTQYEPGSATPLVSEINFTYDALARVTEYENKGNVAILLADDYKAQITYHSAAGLTTANILNVPSNIVVKNGYGSTLKRRTTTVDAANGNILTITAQMTQSPLAYAVTTMEYFANGNLKKITYPPNSNGQSMFYSYTYQAAPYDKFVVATDDAYGHHSTAVYNTAFDKVTKTVDQSGNEMTYTYDAFGRTSMIKAPKELQAGKPYTIKFLYYPRLADLPAGTGITAATFVPVALTKHYDEQHPTNDIETLTFSDGLGRPMQVKKDIYIDKAATPSNPTFIEAYSVSGMNSYDFFGRLSKDYRPTYEQQTATTKYLLNNTAQPLNSSATFDPLDRPLTMTDADGTVSTTAYSINVDNVGVLGLKTKVTVPQSTTQNIVSETYKDVSGNIFATMNLGATALWTKFSYNCIGELVQYKDAQGYLTNYVYDMLGRKTKLTHPDNGVSTFYYDAASNLIKLQTANLFADATIVAPADRFIKYNYHFNRLTEVLYPNTPAGALNMSNVYYDYVASGNGAGQVYKQSDATGEQFFEYGNMGEIVYNNRTIYAPNLPTRTFETYFQYDSWNRLQKLTYPDGEEVSYAYNVGGNLQSMTGTGIGDQVDYIKRIDYDLYEQRTYLQYGNGTETFYSYSPTLRRLEYLNAKTSSQEDLFFNKYGYDKAGNVLAIDNSASATSNDMGGKYLHNFTYDKLNRLITAGGEFNGSAAQISMGNDAQAKYTLSMSYNATHGITNKTQSHTKNSTTFAANTYVDNYAYIANTHKVATVQNATTGITETFTYDLNGNLKRKQTPTFDRRLFWDESNRLRVVKDPSSMQHYIYDGSGERVLKASSDYGVVNENGTLSTTMPVTLNGYTTYPSGYIVIDPAGIYSKHYYAGSQRIVSRLGESDASIFEDPLYRSTGEPSKDRNVKQLQIDNLQQIMENAKLPKVQFSTYKPRTYEEIQSALAEDQEKDDESMRAPEPAPIYFYHPDHLGTSTFLTDINGNAYQFFLNLPFGETMAEQLPSTYYQTPYKFNGKELDEETGLYYYGARYYDPKISIWYSVDPLAEKFPNVNPFIYSAQNPISYRDPDGKEPTPYEAALMASHVYGDAVTLTGGWKISSRPLPSGIKNEYASGFKANLYEREKPDGQVEYAYVYAGTEDIPKDGLNDLTQAYAASAQYDQAISNSKAISGNLSKRTELTFVGHSLGGGLANASALKNDRKSVTFNPAWLSMGTLVKYGIQDKSDSRLNNYILSGEILHAVQYLIGANYDLVPKGNNHIVPLAKYQHANPITRHKIPQVIRALAPGKYEPRDERSEANVQKDNTRVSRSPRYF